MSHGQLLCTAAAAILTSAALVTDLRSRRIPDRLTGPALLAGLLLHALAWGWASAPGQGVAWSLAGLVAAPLPFLAFERCFPGAFGGGDLKLLAALGALLGLPVAVEVAVRTALAGGVLGLGALLAGLLRPRHPAPSHVPYGLAIAAGAAWTAWGRLP